MSLTCARNCPTVCVTRVWAGVENAWEQDKLEARKMLEKAQNPHTSGARFVRRFCVVQDSPTEKDTTANLTKFYALLNFWKPPKN